MLMISVHPATVVVIDLDEPDNGQLAHDTSKDETVKVSRAILLCKLATFLARVLV